MVKESGDETITEELSLIADDAEMVFDVSGCFFQVEGEELIADGDTLVEGAVGGKGEFVSQVGLAQQHQGQVGGRVEVIIEQEVELAKEVRGQAMGFINGQMN